MVSGHVRWPRDDHGGQTAWRLTGEAVGWWRGENRGDAEGAENASVMRLLGVGLNGPHKVGEGQALESVKVGLKDLDEAPRFAC